MSQTIVDETTPEGTEVTTTTIIPVNTPLYQANGTNLYKLNVETSASQVIMGDGVDAETRITTLERALAGNASGYVVDNIEERDALKNLIFGDRVTVLDASDDETVESGGATYIVMKDFSFRKIAEDESMDVVCTWEHLQDKPESDVKDIDTAVLKQHVHKNAAVINLLGDDGSGEEAGTTGKLMYNGKPVYDEKRDVGVVAQAGEIPANLRDGGLIIVNAALAEALGE